MEIKKEIKVAAQILEILAKNKCSVAEAETVLHTVSAKVKDSATLHEADYFEELTRDLDRPISTHPHRFSPQ